MKVDIGLDVCIDQPPACLRGARFGLLMNQASIDDQYRYSCDVLASRLSGQLVALFSPQHGLWSEEQDNMIETPHGTYERLGIPVYSLYSETREPTEEMLEGLDCLVVDLQDVGTRVYTFAWTISYCLAACSRRGIPVVVLDRPNPLGGEVFEGPCLEGGFASFVGRAKIPMRHGLTLGELANLLNDELALGAEITVVPMRGWQRRMLFTDTGQRWVAPSPNLPRIEGVWVYPGQVLIEGTNLSEGRGTTTPFEVVGAPFVDPNALAQLLGDDSLPGVALRPIRFCPTFNKWQGRSCGGVSFHVTDPREARSYVTALALLAAMRSLYPEDFGWLQPPYEYESERMPIDILSGSERLRAHVDGGRISSLELQQLAEVDEAEWLKRAREYWLYA